MCMHQQQFGLTFINLAFSWLLEIYIFKWAFVPGRRFSNSLPSQILNVTSQCVSTISTTFTSRFHGFQYSIVRFFRYIIFCMQVLYSNHFGYSLRVGTENFFNAALLTFSHGRCFLFGRFSRFGYSSPLTGCRTPPFLLLRPFAFFVSGFCDLPIFNACLFVVIVFG